MFRTTTTPSKPVRSKRGVLLRSMLLYGKADDRESLSAWLVKFKSGLFGSCKAKGKSPNIWDNITEIKKNVTVNKYEFVKRNVHSSTSRVRRYTILPLKTGGSGRSLIGAVLYERFLLPSLSVQVHSCAVS